MKHRLLPLLSFLAAGLPALAQLTEPQEVVAASSMLAFGRPADAAGLAAAGKERPALAALLESHRRALGQDAALQRSVASRAFRDAHGRVPTDQELATLPAAGVTYVELLKQHVGRLATQPAEYRQVIDRAYRLVINRAAYEEEYAYWKPHGTLPFVLLIGAVENWAQRNQPGLMVTTGTPSIAVNSRFLLTQRLSLPVANEARTLLGLPVWTDVARLRNPGHNVVAVAAADIASVGGVHFALAGGGPLAGE